MIFNTICQNMIKTGFALFVSALLLCMPSSVHADTLVSKQHQIMASFLLQLASFAQWPDPQSESLNLCILGPDPFKNYIDAMVKRRPKNRAGQLIVMKRLDDTAQGINSCGIVFAQPSHYDQMWSQLLENHSVLLVSHSDHFIATGGMINFAIIDKRIKLEVNLPAVLQANIKLSSSLLKHAKVISGTLDTNSVPQAPFK